MDNLPKEIILHILGLCDPIALVTCRAVCKPIRKLIEDSPFLQYLIELFADGMIETQLPYNLSTVTAERLSLLRSRRAAWKALKWTHLPTPIISGSWSAYELVDGIFARTLHLAENRNATGIVLATLPSKHSPGAVAIIDRVGIPFRDFAMDPTQDLIIYMQCDTSRTSHQNIVTLHFRTMSNNQSHPRAREPHASVVLNITRIVNAVIQIANDVVGFMYWGDDSANLHILNWKQSKILVSESHLNRFDDFAFVSESAYVRTSARPEPCLRVFTFHATSRGLNSPHAPTLRVTLYLPLTDERVSELRLSIHTGPITTKFREMGVGSVRPFTQNSLRHIYIISLEAWIHFGVGRSTSCLLVVHNNTFLNFVTDDCNANPKPAPVILDWEAWGPDQTRWLPGGTGSAWLRYVHGERLVRLHRSAEGGPRDLEVYDFGAPRGPWPWYGHSEHTTSIIDSLLFNAPVVGRLPYHMVKEQGDFFPYLGFMIDEERLIGLKDDWGENAGSADVFAF